MNVLTATELYTLLHGFHLGKGIYYPYNLNSLLFFLLMLVLLTFRPLDSQCIFKLLPQRTDPEVYHFNDSVCVKYTLSIHTFFWLPRPS